MMMRNEDLKQKQDELLNAFLSGEISETEYSRKLSLLISSFKSEAENSDKPSSDTQEKEKSTSMEHKDRDELLNAFLSGEISETEYSRKLSLLISKGDKNEVLPNAQKEENNSPSKIYIERLRKIEEKIEKSESVIRDVNTMLQKTESMLEKSTPLSRSEVEELILETIKPLGDEVKQLQERIAEAEERKDLLEHSESEKSSGFDTLETEETEKEQDDFKDDFFEEEEEKEEELDDYEEDNPKKKSSTLLKAVIATLLIFVVALGGGYFYIKYTKNSNTQSNLPVVNTTEVYQPAKRKKEQPKEAKNYIDTEAVSSLTKKESKEVPKKIVKTKTNIRISDEQSLPAPKTSSKKQDNSPKTLQKSTKKRSPIENELIGDKRSEKADIPFLCRLKPKYPSGEYVYYVRAESGKYIENPIEDTFVIEEKAVLYNYSPDNDFVKLSKGKYMKRKIYAECKPIRR